MNIQLNTAASTMRELQKKVDVIANNIANVNTTGYKRHEANFSDTLVQSIERQAGAQNEVGRVTPNGLRVGTGAKVSQTSIVSQQGSIQQTGRDLDFVIQGENGFFRVASEGNTYYTRDGSFQLQPVLNSNLVNLVTSAGDAVLDINNNPIVFNGGYDQLTVNENGLVQISYSNGSPNQTFQLSIAEIQQPNLLEKAGSNRYQLQGTEEEMIANGRLRVVNLTGADGDGSIRINQGMLEMSNVDLTEEMTELISTQRLIQSQGRAITFADDMMGLVNNMRG